MNTYQQHDLYQLCLSLISKKNYLEALERIKLLLSKNSTYYHSILQVLYKKLQKSPSTPMLHIMIVELYVYKNEFNEAVFQLECLFEEAPQNQNIFFYLSRIYQKATEKKRIISIFEKAIEMDTLDSSIIDILPSIYIETNQIDKSIALYQKLIQKNPSNQFYLRTIADLLQKNNEFLASIHVLRHLLDVSPNSKESIIKECDVIAKLTPKNTPLQLELIDVYLLHHQPTKVLPLIHQLTTLTKKEIEKLIKQLKTSIKTYPYSNEIKIGLAELLIQKSQFSEAAYYIEMCIEQNYTSHETSIKNALSKIIQKNPQHFFSLELIIEAYFLDNKYSDVLDIIHHYTNYSPQINARIYHILEKIESNKNLKLTSIKTRIKCLFQENKFDKCITECNRYLKEKETSSIIRYKIKALMKQNQIQESHQIISSLLIESPYNAMFHTILQDIHKTSINKKINEKKKINNKPKQKLELGLLHLRNHTFKDAIDNFQSIHEPKRITGQATLLTSLAFIEEGRFDKALKVITRLISEQPSIEITKHAHYLKSICNYLLGHPLKALQDLDTISEYDIKFPNLNPMIQTIKKKTAQNTTHTLIAWFHNGTLLSHTIPLLTHSPPNDFAAHQNRKSIQYILENKLEAARKECLASIKMAENFIHPYINLAFISLKEDNPIESMNWIQTAKQLQTNDIILNHIGLIHQYEKQYETAISYYEKSLELNPNNMITMINLGDLFLIQKDIKSAFTQWSKAAQNPLSQIWLKRRTLYLRHQSLSPLKWINEPNEKQLKLIQSISGSLWIEQPIKQPKSTPKTHQFTQPSLFALSHDFT